MRMSEVVAALLSLTIGWFVTYIAINASWVVDCKTIGAHTYEGKAYDCKVRP